jgi:nitroreductase
VKPDAWKNIAKVDLVTAIGNRESRRAYTKEPLTLEEISFLLWATQGVRGEVISGHAYRTVPSAGCRHAFETYLVVLNVKGLNQGIYRYLPLSHQLLFEFSEDLAAHKVIAIDVGHVCQNLYLACEAIGAGTCAIAAYDQEALDRLLRIDGKDEFVIYLSPVGKV